MESSLKIGMLARGVASGLLIVRALLSINVLLIGYSAGVLLAAILTFIADLPLSTNRARKRPISSGTINQGHRWRSFAPGAGQ
ncbi:MAG TPA: hypothetical protein VI358_08560 [Pseudolabrys sp.]